MPQPLWRRSNVLTNHDSSIILYLRLQVGYCAKGVRSDPLTSLHDNFSFQTSRRIIRFIIGYLRHSKSPVLLWRLQVCVKLFDMYTRIKTTNASHAARVCYANGGCFNEGVMNNSGVVFHNKTHGRNKFAEKKKNCFWKNQKKKKRPMLMLYLSLLFDIQSCSSLAH